MKKTNISPRSIGWATVRHKKEINFNIAEEDQEVKERGEINEASNRNDDIAEDGNDAKKEKEIVCRGS